MSSELSWLQSASTISQRQDPVAEYLEHVKTAAQVVRVAEGLSGLAVGETSGLFSSNILLATHAGDKQYAIKAGEADFGYSLLLVNRGSSVGVAPAVSRLVFPEIVPVPSDETVESTVALIADWPAQYAKDESLTYPRLFYRLPKILLTSDVQPSRAHGRDFPVVLGSQGFNVLIPEPEELTKLASREQTIEVMNEIEHLWKPETSARLEDMSIDDIRARFPHVEIEIVDDWPKLDGVDNKLILGGGNKTNLLAYWLERNTYEDSATPLSGFKVIIQEGKSGVVDRCQVHSVES